MAAAPAFPLQQRIASLSLDATTAWLFPGQGSQAVGMGQEVFADSNAARHVFASAETVLGYPLARLCFQGPEEELRATANAQPAIFVVSCAYLAAALESGGIDGRPGFVAGHSLGEYTALVAADAIDFPEALALVRERGRLMETASQAQAGVMAAILGLGEATVHDICQQTDAAVANLNCPGQVVIGGTAEAVERAMAQARQAGGRATQLDVSGAFHTSLMSPAVPALARAIDEAPIRDPRIPVMANASAQPLTTAAAIRDELKRQLLSPVLWQQSMEGMLAAGVHRFLEIGPGRVLSGFVKRIDGGGSSISIGNLADLCRSDAGPQR